MNDQVFISLLATAVANIEWHERSDYNTLKWVLLEGLTSIAAVVKSREYDKGMFLLRNGTNSQRSVTKLGEMFVNSLVVVSNAESFVLATLAWLSLLGLGLLGGRTTDNVTLTGISTALWTSLTSSIAASLLTAVSDNSRLT